MARASTVSTASRQGDDRDHGPTDHTGGSPAHGLRHAAPGPMMRVRLPEGQGPIFQFALASAALLVVVAAIGALALRHLATDEALNDARTVTVAFSRGLLRNAVTPSVLERDPAAIAALDRRIHQTLLGHPIVRVKVWSPDGTIIYSDAHALIGQRFPLPDDLRESLSDGTVRAEVSDLSRPENRLERGRGKLVEVYLPVRLASGPLVMVEAYHPAGRIDAASRRIWGTFLPMLLGLLAALAAVQIPLAWAQSRRARADARTRERLARDAEQALQAERRRLATELHDGIAQDLAGVAFTLHAATAMPADAPDSDLRDALRRGAEVCRTSMTRMRELLADLRSAPAGEQDLHEAIGALARPLREAGAEVAIDVQVRRRLEDDAALRVHRTVRELLLDLRRRPGLSSVAIGVADRDGDIVVSVEHDAAAAGDPGSAGLDGLADRLASHGGSLTVARNGGARMRLAATVPAS
jgi:two-component system, NarL family, sensor kinase